MPATVLTRSSLSCWPSAALLLRKAFLPDSLLTPKKLSPLFVTRPLRFKGGPFGCCQHLRAIAYPHLQATRTEHVSPIRVGLFSANFIRASHQTHRPSSPVDRSTSRLGEILHLEIWSLR